ncbi:MAG: hypothetical protein Q4D02_01565 [Clostridia bacterium]|nr:hypothetical protein [Clostridia bacterium]
MSNKFTYKEIAMEARAIESDVKEYRENFLKNVELFADLDSREPGYYDQTTYDKVDRDIQLAGVVLQYLVKGEIPYEVKDMWGIEVFMKLLKSNMKDPSEELKELLAFCEGIITV